MPNCKSCKAPIKWIKTADNKSMPVDPKQICIMPGGSRSIMIVSEDGAAYYGDLCLKGTPGSKEGYISHFATCSNASQFRNR
jgi:hypothetical protein